MKTQEKTSRIVADVPERVHKALKIYCIKNDIDMRDLIVKLLAEKGIK